MGMLMYGSGKASYGMIARLFKVLYWIRSMGTRLLELAVSSEIEEVRIDGTPLFYFFPPSNVNKHHKNQDYFDCFSNVYKDWHKICVIYFRR